MGFKLEKLPKRPREGAQERLKEAVSPIGLLFLFKAIEIFLKDINRATSTWKRLQS